MGFSVGAQNVILNWLRGSGATPPAALWLSLHDDLPVSSGNEVSDAYGGRIGFVGSALSEPHPGPTGVQEVTNVVELMTGPSVVTPNVFGFGVWDAEVNGSLILSGITVVGNQGLLGDVLVFPIGSLALRVVSERGAERPLSPGILPIASATVPGAVKIGNGVLVAPDGTISVDVSSGGGTTDLSYDQATSQVISSTGADATLTLADAMFAGLFSPADWLKLAGIAPGATANSPDATLLNRANHTGTQLAATISDFNATAAAAAPPTNLSLSVGPASIDVLSSTGDDVTLPAATGSLAGLFTATNFTKLSGIAAGATVNSPDATLLARANHTGTQAGSTVTGLYTASGLTLNTARMLGRTTASVGAAEEISVGSGLSLSGGVLSATGSGSTNLSLANIGATTLDILSDTGTDVTLPAATTTLAGLFTGADKTKLTGIATGATANSPDATLLNRANHTGTQAGSTVTGLYTAAGLTLNTARILGRTTAATGAAEEISIGAGLLLSGGALSCTVSGGATNLSLANNTANTLDVLSDTGTDVTLPAATGSLAGLFTSAGFTKLSGIATGATANSPDATLLARANHTGTQAGSTVTGLYTAAGLTMNTARLLGRTTAATGAAEEITIGSGLSFTGGVLSSTATGATNLSLANNTANTLDVLSDTGTDVTLPAATGSLAGLFTSAGFTKLSGIATGATANSSDATLLNRANHTGTQAGSTVTGLYTASGMTMSTARMLGRSSASSGAAEEITIGAGLQLTGGTLVNTGVAGDAATIYLTTIFNAA
jgi:hypothetical protein